jgi:malate permease and related proteins
MLREFDDLAAGTRSLSSPFSRVLLRCERAMNETPTILSAVAPVFGIVALGLLIRKFNWLTEEADNSLMRVCVNVLMPCLILDKSLGNPALRNPANLVLAPAIGYLAVGLGMLIARIARPLHGLRDPRESRTFAVCVGLYNYGYVPLPLALLLFDEATAGVLFLHIIGVELSVWTLGVMMFSGSGIGKNWRRLINGPLVAIVIAIGVNALGWDRYEPAAVGTVFRWLGQCAVPLALVLIGAIMADHLKDFHATKGWRVISSSVLLRIGVLPLFLLLAAKCIPMTIELQRVLVLEAAMPAAVFPIVMSRLYNGDPPTAMRVVLATSVVSLVTIPLWIRFGMKLVGI